jgi:transcriptional regulator with XRE-family HTH domain
MRRNKADRVVTKAALAELQALRWQVREAGEDVTRIQEVVVTATAEATPSLTDLAHAARISDSTLSSWRRGLRVPTPGALEVLAQVLATRAQMLLRHAAVLRRAAEEMATPEGRVAWPRPYQPSIRCVAHPESPRIREER